MAVIEEMQEEEEVPVPQQAAPRSRGHSETGFSGESELKDEETARPREPEEEKPATRDEPIKDEPVAGPSTENRTEDQGSVHLQADETREEGGSAPPSHSEYATEEDVPQAPQGPGEEQSKGGEPEEEDEFKDALTEEDARKRDIADAEACKAEGNELYKKQDFRGALERYAAAVDLLPDHEEANEMRATCHANSAICYLKLGENEAAVKSSSAALEVNPDHVKALMRRAQAQEKLEHEEEALTDLKKVVELDPGNKDAAYGVRRLEPIVAEKREKLKEEMLGKLKDLGNSLLGHFGMSMDNFKAVKDPATGSYSVKFEN